VRSGSRNLTPAEIVQACDDSLTRLRTDCIDLYQIHWPNRNVPMLRPLYFDPAKDDAYSSIHEQLEAWRGS
jgi:aryl-alcohol dehydrogenase-like predicted oxidoreductase